MFYISFNKKTYTLIILTAIDFKLSYRNGYVFDIQINIVIAFKRLTLYFPPNFTFITNCLYRKSQASRCPLNPKPRPQVANQRTATSPSKPPPPLATTQRRPAMSHPVGAMTTMTPLLSLATMTMMTQMAPANFLFWRHRPLNRHWPALVPRNRRHDFCFPCPARQRITRYREDRLCNNKITFRP